jgi:MFS transporter, NNP family, nitrate/nitrite transporter
VGLVVPFMLLTLSVWIPRPFFSVVAGWGNLGAGVTNLIIGSFLFPLFKLFFEDTDNPSERAWRTVCIVPAFVAFVTGVVVFFISDDAPKGNYSELKRHGAMPPVSPAHSCYQGTFNLNVWLLFVQYAW